MDVSAIDGFERVDGAPPPPGEMRASALSDGTPICVVNAGGDLCAVQNECAHAAFPLSEGMLLRGGIIQCAWHGAQFDCRTGAAVREPAFDPLVCFDVRELGGALWVRRVR